MIAVLLLVWALGHGVDALDKAPAPANDIRCDG